MGQQQMIKNEYRCFDVPMRFVEEDNAWRTDSAGIEKIVREQADEQYFLCGMPVFEFGGSMLFIRQTPLPQDAVVTNAHVAVRLSIFRGNRDIKPFLDLSEECQKAVVQEVLYPTEVVMPA